MAILGCIQLGYNSEKNSLYIFSTDNFSQVIFELE